MQKTAYKETRAYSSIHKKLMSAIAMLLIASILMVSSTYAWFTLSTAPEVTGITTTVGANGALEIALASTNTWDSPDTEVSSVVGDSGAVKDMTAANLTWGNLVDLSDSSYGLSNIVLNLAALSDSFSTIEYALEYPLYGADGRVSTLTSEGLSTATYDDSSSSFDGDDYGVRAIGTSSNAAPAAQKLTTAKKTVNNSISSAQKKVSNGLANNFTTLLYFAIDNDDTTAGSGADYYSTVNSLITSLENAMDTAGEALRVAYLATLTASERTYKLYSEAAALSLEGLVSAASTYGITATGYDTYSDVLSDLEALRTEFDALDASTVSAAALWTVMAKAVSPSGITVDGDALTSIISGASLDDIASLLATYTTGTHTVVVGDGAGIYYDIATVIGNYTVSINSFIVASGSTNFSGTSALASVSAVLDSISAYDANATSTTMTDFYGYVLDFYLRTNATGGGKVSLTEATARIEGAEDDTVQGAGSYIEFKFNSALSAEQQAKLAAAMKVVFIDPDDCTVYGTATVGTLDTSTNRAELTCDDIIELSQNTAQKLSVLVYIDGNDIDNSATINDTSSMSATINLQFVLDTALVPMTYSSGYAELSEITPPGTYTISGSGNYTLSATSADEGDEITVSPASGYTITSVTVAYNGTEESATANGNTYSFTMPAYDVTLTVVTEETQTAATTYAITTNYTNATVTYDSSIDVTAVEADTTVSFTVTPDAGYQVDKVTVNSDEITASGDTYSFTMPASAVTVEVTTSATGG